MSGDIGARAWALAGPAGPSSTRTGPRRRRVRAPSAEREGEHAAGAQQRQ